MSNSFVLVGLLTGLFQFGDGDLLDTLLKGITIDAILTVGGLALLTWVTATSLRMAFRWTQVWVALVAALGWSVIATLILQGATPESVVMAVVRAFFAFIVALVANQLLLPKLAAVIGKEVLPLNSDNENRTMRGITENIEVETTIHTPVESQRKLMGLAVESWLAQD